MREWEGVESRTAQGVINLHAPLPVDPVIWRDVVLADAPEHELLVETRINPSLFTCSADDIHGLCSTTALTSHELKYRPR